MNFTLSDEQEQLKRVIERFVAERADSARGGFGEADWRLLADLGLLAMPLEDEMSGFSRNAIDKSIAMETFGRGMLVTPLISEIYLAGVALLSCGAREKAMALVEGRTHYAFAHFEHGARYCLNRVQAAARTDDGRARLTGAKTHVLVGTRVDGFVVTARDEGGALGFYFVDATALGIQHTSYELVDGSVAVELSLQDVVAERLSGGEPELYALADGARLAASAEMLGIMSGLFEATLEYVRTRHQFGVAIGSFQAIQHRLADLYVSLEQSRSLLYRAALNSERGRSAAIAAAKSYIAASGRKLAEECVQLHGGMGVTDELKIGRGLKRILTLANLFGESDSDLSRYMALTAATGAGRTERLLDGRG